MDSINSFRTLFLPIILIILTWLPLYVFSQDLTGVVINKETQRPIPYVSIGIKNKPIGTISDTFGRFALLQNYENISDKDSIIFSSVGYKSFKTTWKNLKNNPDKIILAPNRQELTTVNVSAKQLKIKTYGRGPAPIILSPKGYKNMPQMSNEKGREQASIIRIDKDILLRRLNLLVWRRSKLKHITFRMNIYDVKDGLPHANILTKNIVFDVRGLSKIEVPDIPGIDLRPYHIHLKGLKEIALGIEILDDEPLEGDTSQTAFYIPSYPSPFRSSFYRLNSQSPWEKVGSSYLIASLEASVLKKEDYAEKTDENDTIVMQSMSKMFGAKMMYGGNINRGKRVNLGNASIYYETYGKGEPLLLLHGNNGSINSFREQIKPLSKHYKVIAVDSRGQGNSSNASGVYTYELFASDMKQLLDSLHLKKVNILGWSDGGNTGLIMAVKYPQYVNKLVVMGANAFAGDEAIDADVIKIFEDRSKEYANKTDEESINQKKLADLVLNYPLLTAQELQTIQSPVLIMAGENDVIKKEHTLFIHKNIPNSQLEIIKRADHYAPIRQPSVFNKFVLKFLDE